MDDHLLSHDARPGCLVDGEWRTDGPDLLVEDPTRGRNLCAVATATGATVLAAGRAAQSAQASWRATSPSTRFALLHAVADRIEAVEERLARTITREVGKPLPQSHGDVRAAAAHFRFFAGVVDKVGGSEIPTDDDHLCFTSWEPVGVTAHISPWNSPLGIPARSLAAALAMGNTVVFKPSELAPLSGINLVAAMTSAGLPAGVVNLVLGGSDVGQALTALPQVRSVTFTGSTAVGAAIRRSTADRMTRLSLELGGKAPVVVCEDADLDDMVSEVHRGLIRTSGQTCLCPARLIVHRSRYDDAVARMTDALRATVIGDGLHGAAMGPLISRGRLEEVTSLIAGAREYAEPVYDPGRPDLPADLAGGYFAAPALFTDVPRGSPVDQQEVFGPVLAVYPFDDLDEAIALANDVEFGLSAGLWTERLETAIPLARALEAGSVSINGYPLRFPHGPHGGYKRSGMGREQGLEAVRNYVEVKKVSVRLRR